MQENSRPMRSWGWPRPQFATTVGGVGLHFVRNLMDQLEYARRDGVNRLRLVKNLTA
jgi:anti-sigma regulatory factor (Ser/Thr protein kinase)